MRELGTVTRIQIQQSPMKSGEGENRVYNPTPLLEVDGLILTPEGVTGVTTDGQRLLDAHNMRHPQTRHNGSSNGISFGFAHHYESMRERFGAHLTDGIAGENILITAIDSTALPDLTETPLAFRRSVDGTLIELVDVIAAPPCEPFSRFCARFRPEAPEMKAILQFLNDGRRGYYTSLAAQHGLYHLQTGDVLVMK